FPARECLEQGDLNRAVDAEPDAETDEQDEDAHYLLDAGAVLLEEADPGIEPLAEQHRRAHRQGRAKAEGDGGERRPQRRLLVERERYNRSHDRADAWRPGKAEAGAGKQAAEEAFGTAA